MIIACWYQWCHQEIVSLHGFPLLPSCPKYSQASMPLFGVRCLPAAPGTFPAVPTNFPKVGFHWTSLGPMPIPQPIVVIKGRKFFILQILSYRGLRWPIQSTRPNGVFPQGNSRIAKQNQQPYIYINCRERGRNSNFESWVLGSIVYMKMKAFLLNSYALILFSFFSLKVRTIRELKSCTSEERWVGDLLKSNDDHPEETPRTVHGTFDLELSCDSWSHLDLLCNVSLAGPVCTQMVDQWPEGRVDTLPFSVSSLL